MLLSRAKRLSPAPVFFLRLLRIRLRNSSPDFGINPDSVRPGVYWIAPKMLWIYYVVSVSYFAGRENRPLTA